MKRILILSPHTDDAELGCGASMARLIEEGSEIYISVFSTCEESLPDASAPGTLLREFNNAYDYLGIDPSHRFVFNYPVRHLSHHRQAVLEELVKLRKRIQPDLVILPSGYDLHQDHQVVHMEGVRAFLKYASIWGYELPWNHKQFSPIHFVRVEERHIQVKIKLLSFYKSQLDLEKNYFSEDFIRGLARVRGVQSSCMYSESFEIIRQNY